MLKYKVRWKGKELGEFTRSEIEANLRSSKMGLLHQVFAGSKWVNLKFFIDEYKEVVDNDTKEEGKGSFAVSLAYFSTGLAFLSPYLILISIALAGYLYSRDSRKNALWVFALSILIMPLGILFFGAIKNL